MPKGSKDSKQGFSSFRAWIKINYITFINAAVTIILLMTIVVVLISQATSLQRETMEEIMVNVAGKGAGDIQTYYSNYLSSVEIIARTMSDYQSVAPARRRAFINDMLAGILRINNSIVKVYTVWKPNALDGMDADFASAPGSDGNGQFLSGFTREQGWVEQRIYPEYRPLLDNYNFTAPNPRGIITEPMVTRIGASGNVRLFDIQLPIVSSAYLGGQLVGIVGITVDIRQLQEQIRTIVPYEMGQAMLCVGTGTIIAHSDSRWQGNTIGSYVSANFPTENQSLLVSSILDTISGRQYSLSATRSALLISYPIRLADPNAVSMNIGTRTGSPPWTLVALIPIAVVMAPIYALIRFSILFILAAGVMASVVLALTSQSITHQARNMQRALEYSTTMNDTLKYGLFLIDGNYIIQGAYTKALENILSITELQKKNFIVLLSASLKPNELQGTIDYLEMVFKNAFDREMLEAINPINEFAYNDPASGDVKILKTSFSLTEQKGGVKYLLVTLEDITAEKELKKQLREADIIRENEMRSLFQVIQLDPRVLRDFVSDTEYEFENINDILKNKKQLQQDVLFEMYQSIHAIKSNALILNLESFAGRLHKMEDSVKKLQELQKEEIPFDDFLSLILELNDAMKEMDQVKETIVKIENFRTISAGEKNQEKYVLVETLSRVCEKTRTALNKKVKFVVEGIDDTALAYGPRREIKEVLTQLMRNAVYHGIEAPAERGACGKEEEGEIRLSIKHMNNQIVIRMTDDGAGIDFNKISKAVDAPKSANGGAAPDRNYLLKLLFAPGFSTRSAEADVHAGRGVGLSLVKDRVKALHGNIAVSTAVGKGTTFTITFPLELPEAVKAS